MATMMAAHKIPPEAGFLPQTGAQSLTCSSKIFKSAFIGFQYPADRVCGGFSFLPSLIYWIVKQGVGVEG